MVVITSSDSNYVAIPSLDEINRIELERAKATEALEIANGFVKCQKCGASKPIAGEALSLPGYIINGITHLRTVIRLGQKYRNVGSLKRARTTG